MVKPHGGELIEKKASEKYKQVLSEEVQKLTKLTINDELVKEVENIGNGVFSPLHGFMLQEELDNVVHHMRLPDDVPWTIPIILDADEKKASGISEGDRVALFNKNEELVGVLDVEEKFFYDKTKIAEKIYGTTNTEHPGVKETLSMNNIFLGGEITLINEKQDNFSKYTLTPKETRFLFREKGWTRIVGFQTRNVPHLGHEYVQKTALTFVDGLFINPVIGKKKKGDFRDEVIIHAYEKLMEYYYLKDTAVLAILKTRMRYAGPREAIFHAIVRKNFGCTHIVIGRDHAGVGDFYKPYEAQEIFANFPDLEIVPLFFRTFFFCKKCETVVNEKTCPHSEEERVMFSGTKIRKRLLSDDLPYDMMRKEVIEVIKGYENSFVE